ncbi:MAG: Gfo/Idh/MocA family oxidoreductase [Trueperaceae bacterium]|nr:MAG: Gfo/Idh/MocA family oxidoreductase [Trueperaceae bacterium]
MRDDNTVAVGVVGTSWWTDAMYLPALQDHAYARVAAICGRNRERAQRMADRWDIPVFYTDFEEMLASGELDALIVASSNDTHYPMTVRALEAGLHVLCEKPLALSYDQAAEMARLAQEKGVTNLTPFTYACMPTARYLKELIDSGYLGRPYHLNLRYYTGYGRESSYLWRFDMSKAGAGAVGDIGSHFIYLARWFFGEITGVFARLGTQITRPATDSAGHPYEQADDSAILTLQFANGALGSIHVTTVAYEATSFGQVHQMEFHGSEGTLHSLTDWDRVQRVSGARVGEGAVRDIEIPEHIWQGARRDTVHNTYRDVFRRQEVMTRAFVTAVAEGRAVRPDFSDGAVVQRVVEAAQQSHREGRWVEL